MTWCTHCDNTGLVVFSQILTDSTVAAGERVVDVAYKCGRCHGGDRFSAKIAMEPLTPPRYLPERPRDRDAPRLKLLPPRDTTELDTPEG
jgi:hypothetical protein